MRSGDSAGNRRRRLHSAWLTNTIIAVSSSSSAGVADCGIGDTQDRHGGIRRGRQAVGASRIRILRTQLLPNVLNEIIVYSSGLVGVAMIIAAAELPRSRIPRRTPEWGYMLESLQGDIYVVSAVVAIPGLFIFLTSVTFNTASDALREQWTRGSVRGFDMTMMHRRRAAHPGDRGVIEDLPGQAGASPGEDIAVDNVSLTVQAGSTLGIVGESGCGKSTCPVIVGLHKADGGSVRLAGTGFNGGKRSRGKIVEHTQMVFQTLLALNPRASVGESIGFPLRVQHVEGGNRRAGGQGGTGETASSARTYSGSGGTAASHARC